MKDRIQWVNALSTNPSLEGAISEIVTNINQKMDRTPDIAILFVSSAFASDYPRLLPLLLNRLPLKTLIGCGGGGIVGVNSGNQIREIEETAAISLSVAYLPNVKVNSFHILDSDLPDLDDPPKAWVDCLGIAAEDNPHFILLGEPFASGTNNLLAGLDFVYPNSVKVGGLSSAGIANSLFYLSPNSSPTLYQEGTIGLALSGDIIVDAIVAQGCRPIGKPYLITQGERNIILELSSTEDSTKFSPPLEILRSLMDSLSESDRKLAQTSLFVGMARDEFKMHLSQGDFLIRNLLGVDPKAGAMAIGDRVRSGQRMQFHLRDAKTSAQDLDILFEQYQENKNNSNIPVGALMFSCLGRGQGLYKEENFDSNLYSKYFPNGILGGFFCNGEIGPVGRNTFLHGYTSVFAIFSQPA